MFTKACVVLIATALATLIISHRAHEVAHAQERIEYKVVRTEVLLAPDGKEVTSGENVRLYRTQDALDEFAKTGWQLVTASFVSEEGNPGRRSVGHLIFVKK